MALDSFLYINTQKDISEIISWLIENMDYEPDKETDYLLKEGLIVRLCENEPNTERVSSYNLLANICFYFRLDKSDSCENGYINMIETVMLVLEFFAQEAIMFGVDGAAKLILKNGQLILHKGSWDENDLSLNTYPYIIREIEDI